MNELEVIYSGNDAGNTSNKVSYLNAHGNIESFAFSTIAAPADAKGDPFKDSTDMTRLTDIDRIHVHITSKSINQSYWYVGDFARDKEGMIQPSGGDKHNSELHTVTTLTGLALVALKQGFTEVKLSYSGGLPIEEHKRVNKAEIIDRLTGKHIVEFKDGKFIGKKVELNITGGNVYAEGIISSFGLKYNIVNNELTELQNGAEIGEEYALADLGAGTLDLALYEKDGLNGQVSTNVNLGTNEFIDRMMAEISELSEFDAIKKFNRDQGKETSIFRNREEFMKDVVIPGVSRLLDGGEAKFLVNWARVRDLDVTKIVLKHMESYYEAVLNRLEDFWFNKAPKVQSFVLVGGGVLFGYYYFRDLKQYSLPSKEVLADSAHFTSRAYLIANYIQELAAREQVG